MAKHAVDKVVGKQFGMLWVKERIGYTGRVADFKCICNCGNEVIKPHNSLLKSAVPNCGCLKKYRQAREVKPVVGEVFFLGMRLVV